MSAAAARPRHSTAPVRRRFDEHGGGAACQEAPALTIGFAHFFLSFIKSDGSMGQAAKVSRRVSKAANEYSLDIIRHHFRNSLDALFFREMTMLGDLMRRC
jgi:hypothetical protein